MIPIYKLDKLPRMQRLRKIAKYFANAEKRLLESSAENPANVFTLSEKQFFSDSAKFLSKDNEFSLNEKKVFEEAIDIFENTLIENNIPISFTRTLNNIKHILFTVTGNQIADWDFTTADRTALDSEKRKVFEGMYVYLEDIRSPFNVGAMFRTAESFGVEKIILSPFCADPRHPRAERTAMGCIDIVPWERQELFTPQQSQNTLPVFALETGGTPINEFKFPEKGLLIAGSEELGVSPRALEAADLSLGRVSIPIFGAKASINVSTAFGIALQYWANFLNMHYN